MLRLPVSSSTATTRAIGFRVQRPQWVLAQRRARSDIKIPQPENTKPSIKDPKPPVFPGGASEAAPPSPPPAKAASPASPPPKSTTPVPLIPPSPPKVQTSPPQGGSTPPKPLASSPPPPPPAATASPIVKAPKKKHRVRNFLVGLTLLTAGSFAAGVFYSLKSDNVHDFFTEYIPFGEDAVLYFEEREFRRRFPMRFPGSGATWKIVDQERERPRTTDVGKPGPHISSHKTETQTETVPKAKPAAPAPAAPAAPALAAVELSNPNDPVVQDLVNVVNNIIKTVNDTGFTETFGPAIDKAKSELSNLNDQIGALKSGMERAVKDKLNEKDLEFAKAAQGLLKNVNNQVEDMQHQLRDEFEAEREKIAIAYQRKLQTELERSREVSEQRFRNELLEQAIEMKRSWISEIENRVEHERNGRLGKLKELEEAVEELEKLTVQWNDVINTNLKTQQTFTALETVKASYESPDQPKPFLREMAALKEVAGDDEVIRAAIASINPAAYQNGVSTHTQLMERFRKLSGEVRLAALLPEDAGIAAHAGNWVLSKLMFKKNGLAQGNDVESILAKTETYLEEGNVDSAAREMNQLSGWARTLANDWLREARLVLEIQQALDVIAAEARVQSLRVQKNH
ncbi:mitochondrial inner membrane protein-domain-containing protein [Trichophaea hybrida]|nr:mitochondrial inner membrane protein-domain-containing protein [Trichophaea hybrida]